MSYYRFCVKRDLHVANFHRTCYVHRFRTMQNVFKQWIERTEIDSTFWWVWKLIFRSNQQIGHYNQTYDITASFSRSRTLPVLLKDPNERGNWKAILRYKFRRRAVKWWPCINFFKSIYCQYLLFSQLHLPISQSFPTLNRLILKLNISEKWEMWEVHN